MLKMSSISNRTYPLIILSAVAITSVLLFIFLSPDQSIDLSNTNDTNNLNINKNAPTLTSPVTNISPLVVPSAKAQTENLATLSKINNELAINLYRNLEPNPSKNIFFSPTSLMTALSIGYEGADGNTSKQFEDALGFSPDDDIRRYGFNTMITSLNSNNSTEYDISLANAVWLKGLFEPYDTYKKIISTYYDSTIETFLTPESGSIIINSWASNKTNGIFKEIVTVDFLDDPYLKMIITNAIYFKGTWVNEFLKSDTTPRSFWTSPQNEIKTDTMFITDSFKYVNTDAVQMIELPYNGDRFSMLVILPNEIDGIYNVESSLTVDSIEQWRGNMRDTLLDVYMPKFTLNTSYEDTINFTLQTMDITDAFAPELANFSKLSDTPKLFIDSIVQNAFVSVDEKGTEAAAITIVSMHIESMAFNPTFRMDHPFIFIIWDDETKSILFMGRLSTPTV